MFKTLTGKLYIGKSKLQLCILIKGTCFRVDPTSEIRACGNILIYPGEKYLPDWVIPGKLYTIDHRSTMPTFEQVSDYQKKHPHNLYVTGIPKDCPNLDKFRLNNSLWSSYYEDDHRGYLFQILPSNEPLKIRQ